MKLILLLVTLHFGVSHKEGTISRLTRSDDSNMAALEVVVQQQGTQIQQQAAQIQQQAAHIQQQATNIETLQAKLTALENRVSSVSTPVAFTVHFHEDEPNNGIGLGPQQTLKFDNVVTNIGGGYNEQTGIFTAPVSGVYSFFLTIMSPNAHVSIYIAVVKNGSLLDIVYAEGKSDINDQGSTQVSTHLQSGQQVWAQQYSGDAVRGSWYTIFTGYLIQAD